jgi:hypothetical protein
MNDLEARILAAFDTAVSTATTNVQSGNYTLAASDMGGVVHMTGVSPTLTIPTASSAGFVPNNIVEIFAWGGPVTLQTASGVSLFPPGFLTVPLYSTIGLRYWITYGGVVDLWVLTGDYTP